MKRSLGIGLSLAIVTPIILTAAVSWGASADTGCWDEYNKRGTRMYRTVTPQGLDLDDCTPADSCKWGYAARDGRRNRLYVPHGQDPATACSDITTTTLPPITTTPPTPPPTDPTTPPTVPGGSDGRFELLPVGAALPSDAACASQVRSMSENRPENVAANSTPGNGANTAYPRVTGNFTGTTDEIIQWTACKWGIDEDMVRSQIVNESFWKQEAMGDFTTNPDACIPRYPIGNYPAQYNGDRNHSGECPESIGLGQVRWLYHQTAFDNGNAIDSSAYNLDYTYAIWRTCYEGGFEWLNTVEGRGDYAAGDAVGCLGVWFSGRWYTDAAIGYIDRFNDTLSNRTWEQEWFPPAQPDGDGGTSTTLPAVETIPPAPTTQPPAPTTPETTQAPSPTTPVTTQAPAPTTVPPPVTTPPPGQGGTFFEDFAGNSGLERFQTGVYHRDDDVVNVTSWPGDHDLSCGPPTSSRTIHRDQPDESFYLCRDHLMTSVGDTSGYSIAWFTPDQTFNRSESNVVSWDVNMTDLGNRQWWEVAVIPAGTNKIVCHPSIAVDPCGLDEYVDGTAMFGTGPWDEFQLVGDRVERQPGDNPCGFFTSDPEACGSKATRRTFTMTDNMNGTITVDYPAAGRSWTIAGSFPEQFEVVFKDHNYTPDKDNDPVGYTWHWDNIRVG